MGIAQAHTARKSQSSGDNENESTETKGQWIEQDKVHGRRGNRNESFSLEKFSNEKRTGTVA